MTFFILNCLLYYSGSRLSEIQEPHPLPASDEGTITYLILLGNAIIQIRKTNKKSAQESS